MNRRSLWLHVALVALTTTAAFVAWTKPNLVQEQTGIEVVPGSVEQLTGVRWQDDEGTIELRRDKESFVVAVARKKEGGAETPKAFPGSEKVAPLVAGLAPLRADRTLGKVDEAKNKELGFEKPSARIELAYGDRKTLLLVGNATFGSTSNYLKAPSGEVYLLPAATIAPLRGGGVALQDRLIAGMARTSFDRVVVRANGKTRDFVQRSADEPAKAFFADPADPTAKLAPATEWMDRLLRTRMLELVDKAPATEPAVVVELFLGPKSVAELRLWPREGEKMVGSSTRFEQPFTINANAAEPLLTEVGALLE